MTTTLASPFIPPDDILLNKNTTTGALQLKPGTQGDILYAGASGVWAKLGFGTSGQYLQTLGTGANPQWSAPPGEGLTHLETLTPSGVSTITSSSLSAYDEYIVVGRVSNTGAGDQLRMQINGDTGSNYRSKYFSGTTCVAATSTSIIGCDLGGDMVHAIYFRIMGKTANASNGYTHGYILACNAGSGSVSGLYCDWTASTAQTQITSFTFFNSGAKNFPTGTKFEIFGRNFG